MNKGYQLEQLQTMLDNLLSSGLYLIDTDLTDDDIEWHIKRDSRFSYYRGFLLSSSGGTIFESFVIKLSLECVNDEIENLRGLFFNGSSPRELLIQSILALIMRCVSEQKKAIIHICGDFDLTSLAHDDLFILQEAIAKGNNPIVIVNKKKAIAPLIKTVSLKEKKGIISMKDRKRVLHISYKHDTDYENAMKSIQTGLEKNSIPYSIDEYDIMYRDNIDDYEKEIGASDRVIMFVIPSYLESLDCMFEMTQMFKNGNVRERIFPVVDMGGLSRNGDGLKQIKDFWQEEKVRKSEQIKTEQGGSSFVMQEIEKIDDIILTLNAFWRFICRDSTGKYEKLIENDAALLVEELNKTWPKESGLIDENFVPSDDTKPAGFRTVIQNGNGSVYIENSTGPIIIGGDRETGNVALKNEAYFNDIANQIINDLDGARVSIHVAIAWFTNQRIADKLVEKFKDGLDVKVVYFKDHTNSKFGVNIDNIPFKAIRGTRGGTMHNKFCVIDNQKVITGSYNWSENAENKNDENAAVMYDNDCASSYSVEFRRLFASA